METQVTILKDGRLIQVPLSSILNGEQGISEGIKEQESIFIEDRQAAEPEVAEGSAIAPSKGKKVAGNKRNLSGKGDK